MERDTRSLIGALPFSQFDSLEISGTDWSAFGFKSYKSTQYPPFDICDVADPRAEYDLIIAEQVFEHVLWPYRAGRNVHALLRPGGYFLVTTPFLVRVHEVPQDCTRWTPTGMRYFLAECGFPLESVQAYSWGNKGCVIANLDSWVPYSKWRHSLENSPLHPYHVWALAQKAKE